jgi:hypothetical protein
LEFGGQNQTLARVGWSKMDFFHLKKKENERLEEKEWLTRVKS